MKVALLPEGFRAWLSDAVAAGGGELVEPDEAEALVWAVPDGRRLHALAQRAGLVVERSITVDMGGFPAELSVHRKPHGSAPRPGP